MSKLILMQGLPASGKSTRAEEIAKEYGNCVRLNRDYMRTMLHFDKWNGRNERVTSDLQILMAKHLLLSGKVVIIDDTNFGSRVEMWKGLAKEKGYSVQVVKMDTTLEECLRRDAERPKPVGRDIIIAMAMQHGLYPVPSKGFVICDIDGTLADISHRLHFVRNLPEGEKKDWKSFFAHMGDDKPRIEIVDMLLEYEEEGYEIVFVSARPDDYRRITEYWIVNEAFKVYDIPTGNPMGGYKIHKTLLMRRAGDKRDDTEVKQDIYNMYFKGKYPIHMVIDDRPSVIRMWKENGLQVTDVGRGEEF